MCKNTFIQIHIYQMYVLYLYVYTYICENIHLFKYTFIKCYVFISVDAYVMNICS